MQLYGANFAAETDGGINEEEGIFDFVPGSREKIGLFSSCGKAQSRSKKGFF